MDTIAPRSRPLGGRLLVAIVTTSLASAVLSSVATVAVVTNIPAPATAQPGEATAATAGTSEIRVDLEDAVVAVAAKASPAVVTITTSSVGTGWGPFSMPSTGVGSGFVFDADGWILTNRHVVEGSDEITVALKDGLELAGRVAAGDPERDLAVVKVDAADLPTVQIGSSAGLKVGQLVVAIGSPLGTFTDSVTSGILSATGRTITVTDAQTRERRTISGLLQTDAAINQGNSGGPLLDSSGRAIGINSAIATSAEGIGFAIPIDAAASIMETARTA